MSTNSVPLFDLPELRGSLAAAAGVRRVRAPRAGRILSCQVFAETAGTGGSSTFDLRINGTSVFPTTKPTLAASETAGSVLNADSGVYTFASGDMLMLDVLTVAPTAPQNVSFLIKWEVDGITLAVPWADVGSKPSTFPPDTHTHAAADITSGTLATARLGSGTANSSTYLRGDSTWASIPGSGVSLQGSSPGTPDSGNLNISGVGIVGTRFIAGPATAPGTATKLAAGDDFTTVDNATAVQLGSTGASTKVLVLQNKSSQTAATIEAQKSDGASFFKLSETVLRFGSADWSAVGTNLFNVERNGRYAAVFTESGDNKISLALSVPGASSGLILSHTNGTAGNSNVLYTFDTDFVIKPQSTLAATFTTTGVAVSGVLKLTRSATTLAAAATSFSAAGRNLVTLTGDAGGNTITSITGGVDGQELTLIFTDGNVTISDGSGLKLNSNMTGTADDTLTLVCDGTNWYEKGRSVN